jgi:hypothetical protein
MSRSAPPTAWTRSTPRAGRSSIACWWTRPGDPGRRSATTTPLVELVRRADGRVAGAVLTDAAGRRVEVAANLVVGADGIGSSVARLVEAPVLRAAPHATSVIYGYWPGLD